ncbi:ATP synthase delta chain, chloroplastic-like [Dorcoceras hygrometricum]|uniref:ATP synthase delta chain, chloroplastic-like n=1 Tax=Dorcoceras hygrometricum TaxID=472368 RepID=A0A2Z7AD52_9LAMI|nr:ATP synthase delta chain, chloroplastic-like [Dorcoceras hygrometricum]
MDRIGRSSTIQPLKGNFPRVLVGASRLVATNFHCASGAGSGSAAAPTVISELQARICVRMNFRSFGDEKYFHCALGAGSGSAAAPTVISELQARICVRMNFRSFGDEKCTRYGTRKRDH